MASLTVTINATSRTSVTLQGGSSIQLDRPASTATLVVLDTAGTLSISTLQTVSVANGGTTIFNGFIVKKRMDGEGLAPPARRYTLTCADWNWRCAHPKAVVTKTYLKQSDQDIIVDAVTEAGLGSDLTATTGTIDSIQSSITIGFDGATLTEVLDEMSRRSGGVWWVDQGKTLHYNTAANATAAAWNIDTDSPNGSTTFDVLGLTVDAEHLDPINSIEVIGERKVTDLARPSDTDSDATSQSSYGVYARKELVQSAISDTEASLIAAELISAGKDPRDSITFTCRDDDSRGLLGPNQKITATCSRLGLSSQAFVTRRVALRQISDSITEMSVEAGDIRPTAAAMLKKFNESRRRVTASTYALMGVDFDQTNSEYLRTVGTPYDIRDMVTSAGGSFTFSAVVRINSGMNNGEVASYGEFSDSSNINGWRIVAEESGTTETYDLRLRLGVTATDLNAVTSTHPLVAGQVHHIAVVCDTDGSGVNFTKFYVDGAEATSSGGSTGNNPINWSNADMCLGGSDDVTGFATRYFWDGFIGAASIYPLALTVYQVRALAVNPLHRPNTSLAVWAFDEHVDGYTVGNSADPIYSSGDSIYQSNTGNLYNLRAASGKTLTYEEIAYTPPL